jgi:thiol-disulfide isomerase/thioredoxin
MKTAVSVFLFFLVVLISCTYSHKNSGEFSLQGEINGQDSGKIVLSYFSDTDLVSDTAEIKNGKFIFTGSTSEPTQATLRDGNDMELAVVYLEPRKMKISIIRGKPLGCKMIGSKTQTEFEILNKMEEPVYEKLIMLRKESINLHDSIKKFDDGTAKLLLEKKSDELDSLWYTTREELYPIELKFVLENPNSFVTPDYLPMLGSSEIISLDSLKSIFNGLDKKVRESRRGKYCIEYIRKNENMRIGNQAPDFIATDITQQTIKLSQFKGKSVVLLDFWASWCVPCRQSLPYVKTIYKKYHPKGFDVIAVSVDENRNAWIEAVKQDSIDKWYNIPIAEKWTSGPFTNDDIFQNYYYRAIPEQLLIDKNGKIIDRFGGYSKVNEESLERQLSQIFDNL